MYNSEKIKNVSENLYIVYLCVYFWKFSKLKLKQILFIELMISLSTFSGRYSDVVLNMLKASIMRESLLCINKK